VPEALALRAIILHSKARLDVALAHVGYPDRRNDRFSHFKRLLFPTQAAEPVICRACHGAGARGCRQPSPHTIIPDSCVVSLAIEMAANLIGHREVSLESQGCRVYPSYLKRLIADSTRYAAVVCCFSRTDLWRSRHAVRVPVPWEDLMAPFARPFG
jgi:hypothetical protein